MLAQEVSFLFSTPPGLSESWDGKGRRETPTPLRSLDLDKLGFEPPAVE